MHSDKESRQNGEIRADTLETEKVEKSIVRDKEEKQVVQSMHYQYSVLCYFYHFRCPLVVCINCEEECEEET